MNLRDLMMRVQPLDLPQVLKHTLEYPHALLYPLLGLYSLYSLQQPHHAPHYLEGTPQAQSWCRAPLGQPLIQPTELPEP